MALLVLGLARTSSAIQATLDPGPVWALLSVFPYLGPSLTPYHAHVVIRKSRTGIHWEPHGAYGFSLTHSPWTEANCSTLCHQQSPNGGLLDLAMCVTSCVRPHLYVLTNTGTAWAYSTLCLGEVASVFILCGPTLGTQNSHPTPFTGSEPHIRQSSQVTCTHILLVDSCLALSISPSNQCLLLPPISMVSLVL